ncbi:MAG: hypothetical protein M1818_001569 [Claussenomyces sp. TS43310]|nr:MAG: hypothetical protein M1818_001569 [Claussenomyces sp. TS43310]
MGRGETNAKKRKRQSGAGAAVNGIDGGAAVDTSKPTAIFKPTRGRKWTVSVALPGSIIANAQSHEARTSLAGHIARALAVFCVDEIVIFRDGAAKAPRKSQAHESDPAFEYTGTSDPDQFLIHLLSFLETPPHLRKLLFPIHPNLRTAGTLPSLDLPHHLRADEWCRFREGVTLPSAAAADVTTTTLVDAGLKVPVTLDAAIPPNTRVTLCFDAEAQRAASLPQPHEIRGEAVDPAQPREEEGYYWGYNVRQANSLSAVFTECAFDGGYDVTIGTSERGVPLDELYTPPMTAVKGTRAAGLAVGKFSHLLLVFGGVAGLEVALRNDAELQQLGVVDVKDVFDRWVNVCPGQGSRTIRTEEAVWIGLMGLRRLVEAN